MDKAVGPDKVSNCILPELANELSTPLASLFNQSVHQEEVPVCLKVNKRQLELIYSEVAQVSFVPKGGSDLSEFCNYRPISLLSNVGK